MADLKDLQKLLNKTAKEMPTVTLKVIEVEGLAFIKKNFRDEGFNTGSGVQKWQARKTIDKRGRDITLYRTNRRGKRGTLNKYGRTIQDRALLVGHKTGGNKLTNSFQAIRSKTGVAFRTYKAYAKRHNEGLDGMPKRQFMGKSNYLDNRIYKKLKREYDKRLKR